MKLSEECWSSFNKLKPVLIADIAFVLTLAAFVIDQRMVWQVEVRWVAFITVICFTISALTILILFDLVIEKRKALEIAHKSLENVSSSIPRIIKVHHTSDDHFFLILGPSDIFFENAIVSIFQTTDEIEERIGIGYVSHIQPGKRIIQIEPSLQYDNYGETWKAIKMNNSTVLGSIVCKPSVPLNHVELRALPSRIKPVKEEKMQ